ncbi:MAG: FtsH protease activity modulator HflK [Saccharospirillaceae bacterium]|nr:FtsH protease activity modulator HflK [Pseudomonadales bacterium]NRB79085.1 FtsH protease activity modulator HflK [Saccharospirillaceae bacterium]
MKNNINNDNNYNGEMHMAWDEPPKNTGDKDPWGNPRKKQNNNDGPPDFDELLKGLGKLFGGGGSSSGGNKDGQDFSKSLAIVLSLALVVILAFVLAKGFYKVNQREQAVVLRLGEFHTIKNAGLNYAIPFIETVEIVDITSLKTVKVAREMLTQDGNVISVEIEVQYRSAGSKEWVLNVENPTLLLGLLTESAQRHVVGDNKMDFLMTNGKTEFAFDVKERLQADLDSYNTGILIDSVNLLDINPPAKVKDSYDEVLRAGEERVRLNNDAEKYKSRIIPEAEGAATKELEDANAYKNRIVEEAIGEARRFELLYSQYILAPEVTRERLYLETVEKIYAKSSKVIISTKQGNNMMVLPLDQLFKNKGK